MQNGASLKVANTALHIKDTVETMRGIDCPNLVFLFSNKSSIEFYYFIVVVVFSIGNLLTIVPEIKTVLGRLKRELLEPVLVLESNTKSSETQTTTPEPQRSIPHISEIPGLLPNSTPDVLRVQPRYFFIL